MLATACMHGDFGSLYNKDKKDSTTAAARQMLAHWGKNM